MKEIEDFEKEVLKNIDSMSKDRDFLGLSNIWNRVAIEYKYAYNFTWLGRPIIQVPQDIYAMQELIWKVKPDLIIETGIAHGGSLIMSASMLALLDYCDSKKNPSINILNSKRKVIGIDIEIRLHNKIEIENHPLSHLIKMIEGSSTNHTVIQQIKNIASNYKNIMVFLDSNHTHKHVLAELKAYAPLVSIGSYCVVWDSGIEDLPEYMTNRFNKPWKKGNNPKTALCEFLKNDEYKNLFKIDKLLENKLMITSTKNGFLQRIK